VGRASTSRAESVCCGKGITILLVERRLDRVHRGGLRAPALAHAGVPDPVAESEHDRRVAEPLRHGVRFGHRGHVLDLGGGLLDHRRRAFDVGVVVEADLDLDPVAVPA